MTDVKIDPKILSDVAAALQPHARDMFRDRAGRWMAVVEVAADEFTDERLRQAQRDMYSRRTQAGTLDELMPGATRVGGILNDVA